MVNKLDASGATLALVALGLVATAFPGTARADAQCRGHRVTILGTSGSDRLVGSPARDVISAGGGDDAVRGMGGHDLVCGGAGDDVLRGGRGDDTLEGGGGDDRLIGSGGFDHVSYESAPRGVEVDLARGTANGHGRDRIESVWWVTGSRHDDVLRGAADIQVLMPRGGDDVVDGGAATT